jgi:hypothetical protein
MPERDGGGRPSYDELVTGPGPEMTPEIREKADELAKQPRKPLPAEPLPITKESGKPVEHEPFTVEAGTEVRTMNPSVGSGKRIARRSYTVWPSFVDDYGDHWSVTWPGSSGYWQRVDVPKAGRE